MRLYLSSFQLGEKPEELVRLAGINKRAAVIVNAGDAWPDSRGTQLEEQLQNLRGLGFEPEELDLRDYFNGADAIEGHLEKFSLVWIKGGNTFVLKRAYEQSGFGDAIKSLLKNDRIVYAGFSAGICIAAPTLEGLDLCDDPAVLPEGYKSDFSWKGIGMVPYSILPHYKSDHPESDLVDKAVTYMKEKGLPFRTLRDGEAIIIEGNEERVVGSLTAG